MSEKGWKDVENAPHCCILPSDVPLCSFTVK